MSANSLTPFSVDTTGRDAAVHTVQIALGDRSYDIRIGAGAIHDSASWQQLPKAQTALIVTNTTVGPLYADALKQAISATYTHVHVLSLPDGEAYKDWQHLQL
ncbi:MAG: 3-dehydroquinate synthase, partial [Burkholderiaceae bacterium]